MGDEIELENPGARCVRVFWLPLALGSHEDLVRFGGAEREHGKLDTQRVVEDVLDQMKELLWAQSVWDWDGGDLGNAAAELVSEFARVRVLLCLAWQCCDPQLAVSSEELSVFGSAAVAMHHVPNIVSHDLVEPGQSQAIEELGAADRDGVAQEREVEWTNPDMSLPAVLVIGRAWEQGFVQTRIGCWHGASAVAHVVGAVAGHMYDLSVVASFLDEFFAQERDRADRAGVRGKAHEVVSEDTVRGLYDHDSILREDFASHVV